MPTIDCQAALLSFGFGHFDAWAREREGSRGICCGIWRATTRRGQSFCTWRRSSVFVHSSFFPLSRLIPRSLPPVFFPLSLYFFLPLLALESRWKRAKPPRALLPQTGTEQKKNSTRVFLCVCVCVWKKGRKREEKQEVTLRSRIYTRLYSCVYFFF